MIEKITALFSATAKVSEDVYGFLFVLIGATLCLFGHKEEGLMVLGAGCAIFKGQRG